jgi:hypothetical protein
MGKRKGLPDFKKALEVYPTITLILNHSSLLTSWGTKLFEKPS